MVADLTYIIRALVGSCRNYRFTCGRRLILQSCERSNVPIFPKQLSDCIFLLFSVSHKQLKRAHQHCPSAIFVVIFSTAYWFIMPVITVESLDSAQRTTGQSLGDGCRG